MEILLAIIGQLNSAVFTLIAVLVALFVLIYKAGGIVKSFGLFEKKNENIDDKIDNIKDSLSTIRATTDLLYQAHLKTVQRQSPIGLTEKGEEVEEKISAGKVVSEHWTAIQDKIDKLNPKNPYDIQTVAMDIAKECFDELFTAEEKDQIKTYAYQTGMNMLEVYPVLGIKIRDKYFEHKKINLAEVDKHDPKLKKQ